MFPTYIERSLRTWGRVQMLTRFVIAVILLRFVMLVITLVRHVSHYSPACWKNLIDVHLMWFQVISTLLHVVIVWYHLRRDQQERIHVIDIDRAPIMTSIKILITVISLITSIMNLFISVDNTNEFVMKVILITISVLVLCVDILTFFNQRKQYRQALANLSSLLFTASTRQRSR